MDQFEENLAFLVPELKRFDYFIIIRGFDDTFPTPELKNKISSIPRVQYVQNFSIEKLKSKENLIF